MKKLTAMLLSLMMCFSLMAIPAQAALIPVTDGSGIIDVGEPKDPVDPDEPGISVQCKPIPLPPPPPLDGTPID